MYIYLPIAHNTNGMSYPHWRMRMSPPNQAVLPLPVFCHMTPLQKAFRNTGTQEQDTVPPLPPEEPADNILLDARDN